MAEEALQIVEERLNCSICLDTYTDPKLLQCYQRLLAANAWCLWSCETSRANSPSPAQPVVRPHPSKKPKEWQASSQHSTSTISWRSESLFQKAETPAATGEGAVGGTTASASPRANVWHCIEHPEEELKLYCETCGELVCYKCCLKGGKHHDHD